MLNQTQKDDPVTKPLQTILNKKEFQDFWSLTIDSHNHLQ